MLVEGFYNFTESKRPPTIAPLCKEFGGTLIDLTDDDGDELKVVLSDAAIKDLFAKIFALDWVKAAFGQAVENVVFGPAKAKGKASK